MGAAACAESCIAPERCARYGRVALILVVVVVLLAYLLLRG